MIVLLLALLMPTTANSPDVQYTTGLTATLEHAAVEQNVSYKLLYAIATVESHFNPYAVSASGDKGLMQISPANARHMKVSNKCLMRAECNAKIGAKILRYMQTHYGTTTGWECRYNIGTKLSQRGEACKRYLAKLKAAGYVPDLPAQTYNQRGFKP